ncbi:ADP-ribosylglycohydrolase family protein, partial [Candidatus Latescibacterota bacterium]
MRPKVVILIVLISVLSVTSCDKSNMKTLSIEELHDKIAGGWAGKIIGVSYGAPTEFRAQGTTYDKELTWDPSNVESAIRQDDIYVQLSFMMTMDTYGIDAPAEKFAESFATAGYRLWHANVQARKNFFDGIMPPASGSPEYSLHADDIDFQIEADYIGFMCPGMPRTANTIADKVGHIMNYGDGVYGGMFVASLYTQAFFEKDIPTIVNSALFSIPAESDYAKCVRDVIKLHTHYPRDWRAAWQELEKKWGDVDICGALQPFNIDAKLNGAYIVMGLLYGNGDFEKTLEISTRCGQDSDCNPSNAAAVIGVINGLSGIPDMWKSGIQSIANEKFIFTEYTFNSAVDNTMNYAKQLIGENGGIVTDSEVKINVQEPLAPSLEVSFPDVVPDYQMNVFDDKGWNRKGNWEVLGENRALFAGDAGAEITFTFEGSGVVIRGNWMKNSGIADVYLDGTLHRTIDTYFWWANQEKQNTFL